MLGKLEVRGLGILEVDPELDAKAVLIADIVEPRDMERYPDPWPTANLLGLAVPLIRVVAFDSSASLKLLAALAMPSLPLVCEHD